MALSRMKTMKRNLTTLRLVVSGSTGSTTRPKLSKTCVLCSEILTKISYMKLSSSRLCSSNFGWNMGQSTGWGFSIHTTSTSSGRCFTSVYSSNQSTHKEDSSLKTSHTSSALSSGSQSGCMNSKMKFSRPKRILEVGSLNSTTYLTWFTFQLLSMSLCHICMVWPALTLCVLSLHTTH